MITIDKGGPIARLVGRLLESWIDNDPEALGEALEEAAARPAGVVAHLVLVVGGTVEAVANLADERYDVVLESIWMQLAADDRDSPAGQVMRTIVAGWTTGDDGTAEALNELGVPNEVPFEELVMHMLGVAVMIGRNWAKGLDVPFDHVVTGWRLSLGLVEP